MGVRLSPALACNGRRTASAMTLTSCSGSPKRRQLCEVDALSETMYLPTGAGRQPATSRVLPMPPGPTMETRRTSLDARSSYSCSQLRDGVPTRGVRTAGRLLDDRFGASGTGDWSAATEPAPFHSPTALSQGYAPAAVVVFSRQPCPIRTSRTRTHSSYWRRAATVLPDLGCSCISRRWASSRRGSSASTRRAIFDADLQVVALQSVGRHQLQCVERKTAVVFSLFRSTHSSKSGHPSQRNPARKPFIGTD